MRKRILLAESTDSVRSVAEQTIRQDGFEVISVAEASKVNEVLEFSRPDLLVIGADLKSENGKPLYQEISHYERADGIPVLVIGSAEGILVDFDSERTINQPLDPQSFRSIVGRTLGAKKATSSSKGKSSANTTQIPDGMSVEDDFLDSALGLDQISVTDSEVLDNTVVSSGKKKRSPEKMIGFDHDVDSNTDITDSSRIESLMITEDDTNIESKPRKKTPKENVGESQRLELADNQFDLAQLGDANSDTGNKDHDYNWFVDAMRDDVASVGDLNVKEPNNAAKSGEATSGDSGGLHIEETSSKVNPVTLGPSTAKKNGKTEGVGKFIDEFKKEMEVLRSTEPESGSGVAELDKGVEGALSWEESVEKLTKEELSLFTAKFAAELGNKVAEKIVAKIDAEKLMQMLKSEILGSSKNKS